MSGVFDKQYKKYDAWYDRRKFAFLSETAALKKVLPKKGKGLEIGVGTGRFAAELGIENGIDPSLKMLKIACLRGINAILGAGENMPFPSMSFDYAAIIITLCFVEKPKEVLKEAARILKNKGRLIIGIVDKDSFLGRFYRKKKNVFYKKAKFFSVNELTRLLRQTGFNCFSYYQAISVLPEDMNSVEKPRKGFGSCGFAVVSARKNQRI